MIPEALTDEFGTCQAAAFLAISDKTLDKYVRSGILRRRNIAPPGSSRPTWRYRKIDLEEIKMMGYQAVPRVRKAPVPPPKPVVKRDYSRYLDL